MTLTPIRVVLIALVVSASTTVTGQQVAQPIVPPVVAPAPTQPVAHDPATTYYQNATAPATHSLGDATAACDSVGSCDGYFNSQTCCGSDSLFGRGIILRSDHAFDRFISPMTNPVFFEDPRNVTEMRAIFLDHKVPAAAGDGDVQLYALQLRARLSENVSLIATKDGYVTSDTPLVNEGWADLSVGLKFNLLRDVQNQRLLSGGFTFELPTGEASALQGNGNGDLNLFLTGARQIGQRAHWISAGGFRIPMNPTDESTSSYWSNHFDYEVARGFYLVSEFNWYHWLRAGRDGAITGVEGLDLFNLGSPGVAGNDIVTTAIGLKFKPNGHNEFGVAYEVPITDREDIIENRFTADWILRF